MVAVFVHVPNSIATNESAAISFYKNISNEVLATGKGAIDIVMGDTNQPNSAFTPRVVTKALGTTFVDAHPDNQIAPVDAYQKTFGGTNATASKKYDVAVYRSSLKKVQTIYLSQFTSVGSGAAAVTDHMGIGVYVEK